MTGINKNLHRQQCEVNAGTHTSRDPSGCLSCSPSNEPPVVWELVSLSYTPLTSSSVIMSKVPSSDLLLGSDTDGRKKTHVKQDFLQQITAAIFFS